MKRNRLVPSWFLGSFVLPILMTAGTGGFGFHHQPPVVSPATATVTAGAAVRFSTGMLPGGTVWSVNGQAGGSAEIGTISADGVYLAPAVAPAIPMYITASSRTSPELKGLATVQVMNAAPRVIAVTPKVVMAWKPAAVLVRGEQFSPASSILADGTVCPTHYVSSTRLEATVPVNLLQDRARVEIEVTTPAPGGGKSAQQVVVVPPGTVTVTAHPLVASYSITLPVSAAVSVEFGPTRGYGRRTWSRTVTAGDTATILVAGMKASSTYHMRARIELSHGSLLLDADHVFTTGPLPDVNWPSIRVTQTRRSFSGGGVDVVSFLPSTSTDNVTALVTDMDGSILWYYKSELPGWAFPLRTLANGNLMLNYGNLVSELDLTGKVIRQISLDELNAALTTAGYSKSTQIHHDVIELPNGHWILLLNVNRDFQDLPGYPGKTTVVGDALVDLDPSNKPVWFWNAFDHLDINRHPWSFPPDWTHANAIVYTPDSNLLLSMRHQNWIVKVDYANGVGTGDVLWRLGQDGEFTLDGGDPMQWFYDQHFPVLVSSQGSRFRIAVYDNGDRRPTEDGEFCDYIAQSVSEPGACYSRAVVLDIDESARTAAIAWDYLPGWFSNWGGSIAVLPNGNVEFDSTTVQGGASRVLEVTGGSHPRVVWTMDIGGGFAYRAYRVPSLYPGVQWRSAAPRNVVPRCQDRQPFGKRQGRECDRRDLRTTQTSP